VKDSHWNPRKSSSIGPIALADIVQETEVFPRYSNKIRQFKFV